VGVNFFVAGKPGAAHAKAFALPIVGVVPALVGREFI
jgi:hypothetical protein